MNKITLRRLLPIVLALVAWVCLISLSSCGKSDCLHLRTKDATYQPTCSQQGYTITVCRDCDYSYKSNFVEPNGHQFETEPLSPTCTEQGATVYRCTSCDYSYTTDYIEPLGHQMSTSVVAPTCENSGHTVYTCDRECGYTYTADFVEPNGHSLTEKQFPATCTEGSYTLYECQNCDLEYRSATSSPLGHDLISAQSLATCTEGGYTLYRCMVCDFKYRTATSEPRGHLFTDTVIRPSFARTGYTLHTCSDCQYSYKDNYVWYSDVFTGSAGDGKGILADGIDLSHWNTDIDWSALAGTGIDYVILRAASSRQMPDAMFEDHYTNARKMGLDVGCYFYTYAMSVEELEAEIVQLLKILDGKIFEYPIYFDMEDPSQVGLETEVLMEMALVFCQTLTDNGYFPAIYTNNAWLLKQWNQEQLTTYYDIWYARYPLDNFEPSFSFGKWDCETEYDNYGMWQYTERGTIAGVPGNVDLNFCYKDYPTIIKKYGYNGYPVD